MNHKRIAALALLAALAYSAAPASAAVTKTGTINVKWNTQLLATLNLYTNYDSTGTGLQANGTILANTNGGSGTCSATDTGAVQGTVNFGNVSADAVKATDCMYENAVNAVANTNSTNWTLTEAATMPAGYGLCALPNGTASFPFAAGALPATQTTRTTAASVPSNTSTTTCATGSFISAAGFTVGSSSAAALANANFGEDIELVISPNAAAGAQTVAVTYTLVAN